MSPKIILYHSHTLALRMMMIALRLQVLVDIMTKMTGKKTHSIHSRKGCVIISGRYKNAGVPIAVVSYIAMSHLRRLNTSYRSTPSRNGCTNP